MAERKPAIMTSVKGLLLKVVAASVIGALFASAAPVGAGTAAAASDDIWIVPITATSDTSGSSPDGINSRQDIVRGVSDDGVSVVIIETAFWQTFRGIELAVEGSDTNFRLSDLIGGNRVQSEIAALSGDGRYVAAVIPRLVGSQFDGFEVIRWEPRAGRYEVFQEVPAAAFFTRLVAISSNGRYIFYGHPVDTNTGELTRIDTATGTTTTIGFTGGSPREHEVAISGDGRSPH